MRNDFLSRPIFPFGKSKLKMLYFLYHKESIMFHNLSDTSMHFFKTLSISYYFGNSTKQGNTIFSITQIIIKLIEPKN